MDFIINNYLWFGIAGVILLMALIGFLAEKTNFIVSGDSKPKKEKKKKQKKDEGYDESIIENMSFTPESELSNVTEEPAISDDVSTPNNETEVLEVGPTVSEEPTIEQAPISNSSWVTEEPVNIITENGEDLTAPFGDVEVKPVTSEESVAEEATDKDVLDEDIWKF